MTYVEQFFHIFGRLPLSYINLRKKCDPVMEIIDIAKIFIAFLDLSEFAVDSRCKIVIDHFRKT